MKRIICMFSLALLAGGAKAQDAGKMWSLEECVQYAIDHNIEIKQREIQVQSAEVQLHTDKMSRLPNLNANVGQNWSFGRGQTSTGLYETQTLSNSNFGVSSSTPLFAGFQISNQVEKSKFDLRAATQQLERAKEDLSLSVASLYLQVLFNKEILKVNQEQLALSKAQIERTAALIAVGKVPQSQLYDIEAQVAKDEVSVVQAKNTMQLSLLDLAQSLELERDASFDVIAPEENEVVGNYMGRILPPDVIYDNAVNIKPVVKEQGFRLESSKKSLKIAKAGYYPKLNLSLSYGNSYYYNYTRQGMIIENEEDPSKNYAWENKSFADQWRDNAGEGIGLSLSIPIFNRSQVKNQVKSAQLNIRNQQLSLDNTMKTLYKEIQTAYLNATAAQEKYRSSEKAVKASAESFKYAQERYDIGKSTVFEFNEAKTKLIQVQSEQIQAKYDYIFRTKILDFYNGIPLK